MNNVLLPPHGAERLPKVEGGDVVGKPRRVELTRRVMVLLDDQATPPERLAGQERRLSNYLREARRSWSHDGRGRASSHPLLLDWMWIAPIVPRRLITHQRSEDLRGLTPLIFAHVNPYGTFELDMERRIPIEGEGAA